MRCFILIFILMTFFSCNDKDLSKNKKDKKSFDKDSITTILGYKYSDTIINNTLGEGIIKYNLKYNIGVPSNTFERRIHLYLSTNLDKKASTFKEIEENIQGVFFDTISNENFNFNFDYKNSGKRILNLAFEDIIFFRDSLKSKDTVIKVKYTILSLPVFVVDSTSILGVKNKNIYFEQEGVFKIKRKDSLRRVLEDQRKIDSMKRVLNN